MCLLWGLGKPAQQQRVGGHSTVTIEVRQPLGVDPVELREAREAAALEAQDRREMQGLSVVGQALYVGPIRPPGVQARHVPNADVHELARLITGTQRP